MKSFCNASEGLVKTSFSGTECSTEADLEKLVAEAAAAAAFFSFWKGSGGVSSSFSQLKSDLRTSSRTNSSLMSLR